jgi:type II secretory pathway component PulC
VLEPPVDAPPRVAVIEAGAAPVVTDPCRDVADKPLRVTARDTEEVWVTRRWLEDAFAHGDVMSSAQIQPSLAADGGLLGLRLVSIKPAGTLEQLGFVEGEEVQTVNGHSILDAQAALEVYTSVRSAPRIEIGVLRHNASFLHVLHVCERPR